MKIHVYQRKKETHQVELFKTSGRSQVIGQFSWYCFKGMSGTDALHIFCNQASKMC